MEIKNFTYLILLLASVSVPLILSFDKKVGYWKNLKYILPAIFITALIFWIWDIRFTEAKVWSFNSGYTLGINLKGMPIEEWLFFIFIPYSCVFIYEVLKFYLEKYEFERLFQGLSIFLVVGFALIGYYYRQQAYTYLTFLFSAIYLGYILLRNNFSKHITKFYFSYFVSLVPFIIVNGILTSLPVVEYNSAHIMNIRILTIPVEDFSYFFLMLLMVTSIYEMLKASKYY